MITGIGRTNKIALRFDDHAQSWRRYLCRPGYRRLTTCIQLADGQGWVIFQPNAKSGMDVRYSKATPHLAPGDFETIHELESKDDVALARFVMGRQWWQGPWTIGGVRSLLMRRKADLHAKAATAGNPLPQPFRPHEPVRDPVKTGSSGDA